MTLREVRFTTPSTFNEAGIDFEQLPCDSETMWVEDAESPYPYVSHEYHTEGGSGLGR